MGQLRNLTSLDIAWIAGLLEGEGTFCVTLAQSPTVAVQMNDKDIIAKVAQLMNSKIYGPYRHRRGDRLDAPHYRTAVYGKNAAGWMMSIYPLMGVRRRNKIKSILNWWSLRSVSCRGRKTKGPKWGEIEKI